MTPGKILFQFKKVISVIRTALDSFIGMQIALRHAGTQEPPVWRQDFTGSRVLVVGTGPSLDHVTNDYFAGFDVVICVNHAILRVPEHPCTYYVSTDVPRTREVMVTEAREKMLSLQKDRRIIFLCTVWLRRCLFSSLLYDFRIFRYNKYSFHRRRINGLPRRHYQPEPSPDAEVIRWIDGQTLLRDFPSLSGSSAFEAVLLAARYHPAEIRLIGVDLNAGRSSALQQFAGGTAAFGGDWARKRFLRLERLVRECGVPIENDSWTIAASQ